MAKRDDFKEVQVPLDTPLDEDPAPGYDHEKRVRMQEELQQIEERERKWSHHG